MLNSVKIKILGFEISLKTEDSPQYVKELGAKLEANIKEIMQQTGVTSSLAAVMVALNLSDELYKTGSNVTVLRNQIKECVSDAGKARHERDTALKENEELRAKADNLEYLLKLRDPGKNENKTGDIKGKKP